MTPQLKYCISLSRCIITLNKTERVGEDHPGRYTRRIYERIAPRHSHALHLDNLRRRINVCAVGTLRFTVIGLFNLKYVLYFFLVNVLVNMYFFHLWTKFIIWWLFCVPVMGILLCNIVKSAFLCISVGSYLKN